MRARPPLRYRVPNPGPGPSWPDEEALTEHLRDRRVSRVAARGDEDVSELVFRVLDAEFPERRNDAIYVALRHGFDRSLAPAFRALSAAASIEPSGAMLEGEGAAARAALVDLADELGRLVVVDGVGSSFGEWHEAIETVLRYGRSARWIFIETGARGAGTADRIVVTSPGGAPSPASEQPLPPLQRRLVDAISLVGRLGWRHLPDEFRDLGARLVDAGIIREHGQHWCTARVDLSTERELAAARFLADLSDPSTMLAAAQVLIRHGRSDEILPALEGARDAIIEEGYGLECWQALEQLDDVRARRVQLAIATRIHTPRIVAETGPVESPNATDRFHWAQVLLERGLATEAAAEARRALDEIDGDSEIDADEVWLFLAQCQLARGDADAATEALGQVSAEDETTLFRRDVLIVGTDITRGERDLDLQLDDLLERLPKCSGEHRAAGRLDLARALHLVGRIREGLQVLETRPSGIGRLFYTESEMAYVAALLHRSAGDVEAGLQITRRLQRSLDPQSMLGWHNRLLHASLLRDRGDLSRAAKMADDLARDTEHAEYRALHQAATVAAASARLAQDGIEPVASFVAERRGWLGGRTEEFALRVRLRTGEVSPDEIGEEAPINVRALAATLRGSHGEKEQVNGDTPDPERFDERALDEEIDRARERGYGFGVAMRARRVALLAIGRDDDDTAKRLADWVRDAGAAQRRTDERFAEFLSEAWSGPTSFLELLELRGRDEVGRLAREIVGPGGTPDRLVGVLADRIRARRGWKLTRLGDGAPWWILADARTLVTSTGVHSLASSEVRRGIVSTLARAGGTATKAELIRAVWEIEDHHPLEDENRLRMAVYKLRKQIGDDESELLVTTDDGYALGAGPILVDQRRAGGPSHS